MTPTTFKMTLSPDGTALRACAWALSDGRWQVARVGAARIAHPA